MHSDCCFYVLSLLLPLINIAFRMTAGHATGFQRLPKMNDSIHFDVKSCKVRKLAGMMGGLARYFNSWIQAWQFSICIRGLFFCCFLSYKKKKRKGMRKGKI